MLPVTIRRVFLAEHRVDFRKGPDGLLGEAYLLGADPYGGDCVLFVKRDQTQLRALIGDVIGLYLVTRRFEGGRLRVLQRFAERPSGSVISTGELVAAEATSPLIRRRRGGEPIRSPAAASPFVPVWFPFTRAQRSRSRGDF